MDLVAELSQVARALDAAEVLVAPVYERAWAGRERYDWQSGVLSVVSREGLIEMKRIAGRTRDLADVEALEPGSEDEG